MSNHRKLYHWLMACLLVVTVVGLFPTSGPAQAQILAPSIKVAPVFHPVQQLTTIDAAPIGVWDANDDIRYVEADIMVTTTVEFWAAEIACTVDRTVLSSYANVDTTSTNQTHDDQPVVTWGGVWGTNFAKIVTDTIDANGKIVFTASKQGLADPIGQNNITTSEKIAVLRFRVKALTGTVNRTTGLSCTTMFLDRNGKQVVGASYQAPIAVKITSGFTIQGTANYQGRGAKNNIGVQCSNNGTPLPLVTTNIYGQFTISNLRNTGNYECQFYGNITNTSTAKEPDIFLSKWVNFNMGERGSMYILPVMLLGGDLTGPTPGVPDGTVNDSDILVITTNWQLNNSGDINGDSRTDKIDLAIATSNWNRSSTTNASHVLYGLARAYSNLYNNRIWLGDYQSGAVTQFIPNAGNAQFFWPMVSPNGSKIVYTRSDGNANGYLRKYELFLGDTTNNSQRSLVTRAMMSNSYDAFAPSWSPDGTRIAFVRSFYKYSAGVAEQAWLLNQGKLTLVDADGRNYRALDLNARIFPPAWLTNDIIVYGCFDPELHSYVCYFDLAKGSGGYYTNIPVYSDMPVVSNGNLFYRYTPESGQPPYPSYLRYAELDWSTSPPTASLYSIFPGLDVARPAGTYVHTDVVVDKKDGSYTSLGNAKLDYYDVSWFGYSIMYNIFDSNKFSNAWYDSANSANKYPRWIAGEDHMVDSQMYDFPWFQRDPDNKTELHALRNTVDWIP